MFEYQEVYIDTQPDEDDYSASEGLSLFGLFLLIYVIAGLI